MDRISRESIVATRQRERLQEADANRLAARVHRPAPHPQQRVRSVLHLRVALAR
jgi:hypothetical protein